MKPNDSIQEELKQIAPFLASLQKSHPFIVPANYFAAAEATMVSVISVEHISDGASLHGSKEHPFHVPDNYFREFPSAVLGRIRNERKNSKEINPFIRFTKRLHHYEIWLAAASVALILVVSLFIFTSNQRVEKTLATTTENRLSDLLYVADIDESVVVDLYIQDQNSQQNQENTGNENSYLRDAVDIDPYLINEM